MISALRFYWVVTATGAVIMALEILSSRMLAPHFGNSVYVWGSIISVFLASLSIGYYWGGRLADRFPSLPDLGRLVLIAAGFEVALLAAGSRPVAFFADLTGASPLGTLLTTTLLFGPASLLLGTVSPYAVRLAARELGDLGRTAGRLFALSTMGSLVGTLLCTFVLIPNLEVRHVMAILVLATTSCAIAAIWGGGWRQPFAMTLAGLLLGAGIAGLLAEPSREAGLLYMRSTPYQTLRVDEVGGIRYLRGDGVLQSAIQLADGSPALAYLRHTHGALLWNDRIASVLVLGMGGGSFAHELRKVEPGLEADYVDIDPVIPEIAEQYFLFAESDVDRVHVSDGRQFLRRAGDQRWDYVFVDAYIGLSVPFHMTTLEFFELVHDHLADNGVLGINLAAGLEDPFSLAVFRTVSERFAQTTPIAVRGAGNVLLFAAKTARASSREALLERAAELDGRFSVEPPLTSIAGRRIASEVDISDAILLTDAFAPADHLIALGNADLDLLGVTAAEEGGR